MNSLERIIELYPSILEDELSIVINPNFTVALFDKVKSLEYICDNPNLSVEMIRKCKIDPPLHNDITWYDIKNNMDLNWNWLYVMRKDYISMRTIAENPDLPWDFHIIDECDFVNWKFICEHPEYKWHWYELSQHKNITMEIIENNLNKAWIYSQVSKNRNVNIEFVKKHLDKDWCWYSLSRRIAVCDNFDLPWVWSVVKIDSWETVRNNINVPWDWYTMSFKDFININIIAKYPFLPWNWESLSRHSNITWDDICNNPQLPWVYDCVSSNPNINWIIVRDNPDFPWNLVKLANNEFNYCPFYQSKYYKKKLVKQFLDSNLEELMKLACAPKRMLQIDTYEPDHPLYGLTELPQ